MTYFVTYSYAWHYYSGFHVTLGGVLAVNKDIGCRCNTFAELCNDWHHNSAYLCTIDQHKLIICTD